MSCALLSSAPLFVWPEGEVEHVCGRGLSISCLRMDHFSPHRLEHQPTHKGTDLAAGSITDSGQGATNQCVFHINVSLSLLPPLPPSISLSLKINGGKNPWMRIFFFNVVFGWHEVSFTGTFILYVWYNWNMSYNKLVMSLHFLVETLPQDILLSFIRSKWC